MNRLPLYLLALLLLWCLPARAQFGSFGDVPIEINAEETRFEGGIAIAEGNVLIRYGGITIYSDYAQYNPDTRDVLVLGNVRLYQDGRLFAGERAIYNLETKQLTGADVRGNTHPFFFSADTFNSLGPNAYQARGATITTSDSSKPDYHLRARSVRIYPGDRVIFRDVFAYIGKTPVMWFPYVYQNLNQEQGFSITPGYSSNLGAYVFSRYTFPLGETMGVSLRLDYMTERSVAAGLEAKWASGKKSQNWGRFRSYILNDSSPQKNETNTTRESIDPNRYRLSFQDRTYLTEDIYTSIDINKLSDARFLQDFEPGEFRRNPNPDNVLSITKWDEDYAVSVTARKSLNDYFDFTERLPELALDIKRQPILRESGLFYDGETSVGYLRRNFSNDSIFADFDTTRADTFHQITFPKTFFGWLNIIPRVGVRGTYYHDSGYLEEVVGRKETSPGVFESFAVDSQKSGGSLFRAAVNAGLEASFKISKAYEGVQSRTWGLDGLRHVLQPYLNYSYLYTNHDIDEILQFDRINPSTRQPALDFPQFNSIDSLANWSILRLGARNRFQTRRDNNTFSWMELNTFVDVRFDRPEFEKIFLGVPQRLNSTDTRLTNSGSLLNRVGDPGTFSNLYNEFRWNPVPWVGLRLDSQIPLFDEGFTEVNTSVNFLATDYLQFQVGHRYLSGNILFESSNQLTMGAYVRFGDNWGFTVRETYEFERGILQTQRYEVHRDLSSWVASFGFIVNDNGGDKQDIGVALTFTLKDLPLARLPFNLDPSDVSGGGGGSGKNR